MTADTIPGIVYLLVIFFSLVFGAYLVLYGFFVSSEKDEDGKSIALQTSVVVSVLLIGLLSFFFRDATTPREVLERLMAFFMPFWKEPRWTYPLILAFIASTVKAVKYLGFYWGQYLRRNSSLTASELTVITGKRLLISFVQYSVSLLILYYLYRVTGSIVTTMIAAMASVPLQFLRKYLFLRMMRGDQDDSFDNYRAMRNWSLLFYIPSTLLPTVILLVSSIISGQTQQDITHTSTDSGQTWVYVKFILGLLTGIVGLVGILIFTARILGFSLSNSYARSEYVSNLMVGLCRAAVLSLFVLPSALSIGGEWIAYAVCAMALYALLESFVAAANVRVGADARRLMSKTG